VTPDFRRFSNLRNLRNLRITSVFFPPDSLKSFHRAVEALCPSGDLAKDYYLHSL